METKFTWKNYFAPTPALFRKIGDSLLALTIYLLANPDLLGSKHTRYVTMSMIAAKFITNFFSVSPVEPNETSSTQ